MQPWPLPHSVLVMDNARILQRVYLGYRKTIGLKLTIRIGHTGVGDAGTDAHMEGTEAQVDRGHRGTKRRLVSHEMDCRGRWLLVG
jgi:hypothetical protein